MRGPQLPPPPPPPVRPTVLVLTPLQSVTLHGWLSPKRTLTWGDVVANDRITPKRLLVDAGIPPDDIRRLQPDVYEWIEKKYVSYEDVPYMAMFPLDPLEHLHGDVSTLVTHRYPCWLLRDIGINYRRLRDRHHMDARWMAMLGLSIQASCAQPTQNTCVVAWISDTVPTLFRMEKEWATLGMTVRDVQAMHESEVREVFGVTKEAACIGIGVGQMAEDAAYGAARHAGWS